MKSLLNFKFVIKLINFLFQDWFVHMTMSYDEFPFYHTYLSNSPDNLFIFDFWLIEFSDKVVLESVRISVLGKEIEFRFKTSDNDCNFIDK